MKKRRMTQTIEFDTYHRGKLKNLFLSLDNGNSGTLDVSEIYELLLSLGLVDNK